MFTLAASPIEHIINHKAAEIGGWWVWTANQTNIVIAAVLLIVLGMYVANKIGTGPESEGNDRYLAKNSFASMIEVIAIYLRDEMVKPLLGERTKTFMPFLWALFFFILMNNLLGLVPLLDLNMLFNHFTGGDMHTAWIGGTATQSIYVTGILALVAGLVINIAGIKELGIGGYLKHLTADAPVALWPLMVTIEVAGIFIKPVALAIRLFANMTAGHTLVATLLMFAGAGIVMLLEKGNVLGAPISLVSAIGVIAIYFLELFVAFLQAFVFMFLTAVFISMLSHHGDHDHEHDDHHTHAHAA